MKEIICKRNEQKSTEFDLESFTEPISHAGINVCGH